MPKIYYDADADLGLLTGKTIAVMGYGSQGHAHALNLKESGCNVVVGLYEGSKSWAKAEADGSEGHDRGRGRRGRRHHHDRRARPDPQEALRGVDPAQPEARQHADVRPRLQHPLQPDRPARRTSTSP